MQSVNHVLVLWTYPGGYGTMGCKGEAGQRKGIPCPQAKGNGKMSVVLAFRVFAEECDSVITNPPVLTQKLAALSIITPPSPHKDELFKSLVDRTVGVWSGFRRNFT